MIGGQCLSHVIVENRAWLRNQGSLIAIRCGAQDAKRLEVSRTGLVSASAATEPTAVSPAKAPLSASAATATFLRARLIDYQGPAIDLFAVECGNGRLRFLVAAHLHKAEPFRSPRVAILDHLRRAHAAVGREQLFQVTVTDAVTQVANI